MSDDFYIGYMPKAPAPYKRFLTPIVTALILGALLFGYLRVSSQNTYGPSTYEFGVFRDFEGVILTAPMPMLAVDRPGRSENDGASLYLLAAPFKFGAQELVKDFDGKRVTLQGSLIYRDNQTMIEIKPDSIQTIAAAAKPQTQSQGAITLRGEIVDSKCFLGAMNPGELKTHKACAIRCISGGAPPVLVVRQGGERHQYFIMVDQNGQAMNDRVLNMVAEPVEVSGSLERLGDRWILRTQKISRL